MTRPTVKTCRRTSAGWEESSPDGPRRVTAFAGEARLPAAAVLNRVTPEVDRELSAALEGIPVVGRLPDSRPIFLNNLQGRPLDLEMPEMEALCDALETARGGCAAN